MRFAATEPRLSKRETIALILSSVCLHTHLETLTIADRKRFPFSEVWYVSKREVIERHTECTNETIVSAPTARQLDLVIGLLFEFPFDVNCSVGLVRRKLLSHFIRCKISKL